MKEALRAILEEHRRKLQQLFSEQKQKIEALQQQMSTPLLNQLRISAEHAQHNIGTGLELKARNKVHFNLKVEFPVFDGTDPRGWLKKCTQYFSLCQVIGEQKVDLAALHLKGPAKVWFNSYILGRSNVMWEEFIVDVCERFRDNRWSKDAEVFSSSGTLEAYSTGAEEIKAHSLVRNPIVPDFYFGGSLFGGLNPAIQSFERCDAICSHGNKCSDSLTVLRNEEEGITKYDCCDELHPIADVLQVFDESPISNTHIKSDEWIGEGQGKVLEGPEVVSCELLVVSDIRLEQANLEHLGKSTTKSSLGMVLDDVAITQLSSEVEFSRAVEQKQVAQQEAERSKYVVMKAEQEKRAAIIRAAGESEAARLYCSKWKTLKLYENHGWKWTKSFSFIVFDPGKLRSPLYERGCVIMVEPLGVIDPEIADIIALEEARQWKGLELRPFENFTSVSVMPAMGSVMTNKYREGYPAAVLVAGDVDEALITMDSPEDDSPSATYSEHITIPSAFIDWSFGDTLKKALNKGNMVDARVEYELWKTSRNEGGYHVGRDMALILGVARFKYQPHWVPLTLLWEAMDAIDEASGEHRGYMLIFRREQEAALLFTLSGKHPSWESVAKYLIEDIPSLLKSPSMRDVEEVIDVECMSLPSNFRDFIKWVVEVRRTEDNGESVSKDEISGLMLKEDLLKQVQEIGLYNYVTKFLSSAYTCARKAAKLGPEETLSDAAAADVHTIHKLEAVSAVFDPGKLVVLRMTIAASSWSGAGTWQTSLKHTLILSLEDKALEEGALIQGFSIFTVISLFGII